MRIAGVTAALTPTLALAVACGGGLEIERIDPTTVELDGIPFYVKKGACLTETVYAQAALVVRAEVRAGPKGPVLYRAHKRTADIDAAWTISDITGEITAADATTLKARMQALDSLPRGRIPKDLDDLPIASLSVRPHAYVDYTNRYTINFDVPWEGSADMAVTLGADGTLTNVEGSADNEVITSLIEPLPTGDIFSLLPPDTAEGALSATVVLEPVEVRYTLTRLTSLPEDNAGPGGCAKTPTPVAADSYTSFQVEVVRSDPESSGRSGT